MCLPRPFFLLPLLYIHPAVLFKTESIFILFLRDGIHVAVKIVKNVGRYREAARSEIQVLEHLNSTDPNSVL